MSRKRVEITKGGKVCSRCKEWKKLTEFGNSTMIKCGFKSECKVCYNIQRRAIYRKNKERILASQKKSNAKHKEERLAYHRKYDKKKREKNRNIGGI